MQQDWKRFIHQPRQTTKDKFSSIYHHSPSYGIPKMKNSKSDGWRWKVKRVDTEITNFIIALSIQFMCSFLFQLSPSFYLYLLSFFNLSYLSFSLSVSPCWQLHNKNLLVILIKKGMFHSPPSEILFLCIIFYNFCSLDKR